MILYFDSYITDQPLHSWPKIRAIEQRVQNGSHTYRKQSRLDVAKYTLASYAAIDWSDVIIKYELQNKTFNDSFEHFILELFPSARISRQRSDNQNQYRETMRLVDGLADEWIFYAGNNDHPFICSETEIFEKLIKKANQFKIHNNNFVSIYYSHFTEVINGCYKGHILHDSFSPETSIIEDDQDCIVAFFPNGNLTSVQIIHKELMRHWFCTHDFGNARIIRSESTLRYAKPPAQIIVVPKKEICRHYDGYFHTKLLGDLVYISPEQVPSLFIPDGFFEKKIKIAYGYDEYRIGWVNINPIKQKYSFDDNKNGTDLMCLLSDIPICWKDRIAEIDINPKIDEKQMQKFRNKSYERIREPWMHLSEGEKVFYIIQFRFKQQFIRFLRILLKPVFDSIKYFERF